MSPKLVMLSPVNRGPPASFTKPSKDSQPTVYYSPQTNQSVLVYKGERGNPASPQLQSFTPRLIIMAFYDTLRQQDTSAAVTLVVNEEELALTFEQYNGKTVSQLFGEYGGRLINDVTRIKTFAIDSVEVPGTTQVRPGETVRGVIKAEDKGAA
jgi:hypothetical protein